MFRPILLAAIAVACAAPARAQPATQPTSPAETATGQRALSEYGKARQRSWDAAIEKAAARVAESEKRKASSEQRLRELDKMPVREKRRMERKGWQESKYRQMNEETIQIETQALARYRRDLEAIKRGDKVPLAYFDADEPPIGQYGHIGTMFYYGQIDENTFLAGVHAKSRDPLAKWGIPREYKTHTRHLVAIRNYSPTHSPEIGVGLAPTDTFMVNGQPVHQPLAFVVREQIEVTSDIFPGEPLTVWVFERIERDLNTEPLGKP